MPLHLQRGQSILMTSRVDQPQIKLPCSLSFSLRCQLYALFYGIKFYIVIVKLPLISPLKVNLTQLNISQR